MTIEERIKQDPAAFTEVLDSKTPQIKDALIELSKQLDVIIGSAIKEYSAAEGVDVDMSAVRSYKTMNKIITSKLDEIIGAHIAEKRKDL